MGKKKNFAFSAFGVCFVTYVYFTYFYISDPNDVIRANQELQQQRKLKHLSNLKPPAEAAGSSATSHQDREKNHTRKISKKFPRKIHAILDSPKRLTKSTKKYMQHSVNSQEKTLVVFPEYPNATQAEIQRRQNTLWGSWLAEHGYISVGEYYNHCGNNRIVIGQFVIVHDNGDIKFKTFINTTWTETVSLGTIHVHVSYAGISIIKLAQDICRSTRKAFKCPLQEGFNTMNIDFKLPSLAPKGRYNMQAWGQNKQGYVLACLITEVVI